MKNPAAVALGSIKSARKAASSRANGAKSKGAPRYWWLLLSGEGTAGTWSAVHTTARGVCARLRREQAGGDSFCSAWFILYVVGQDAMLLEYREGRMRDMPVAWLLKLGVPEEALPK